MPHAADLARYLARALSEVCFGSDEEFPLAQTIARYFTPDYTQLTDGVAADYDQFTAHIKTLRGRITGGTVAIERLVRDGNRFADRHAITMTKADGTLIRAEVYLFGELADDGRLRWVEEVSRIIDGDPGSADIASAR
jgi:SnoaL-like domain